MQDVFHLKIKFDRRCCLAGLYQVNEAPSLVAVSVYNKMVREKNVDNLVTFIRKVKTDNQTAP